MTILPTTRGGYPTAEYGPSTKVYSYDLRLEIAVQTGVETVPVNAIFINFVKTMSEVADHPLKIRDVKGNIVTISHSPDTATFQANFSVETVEGRNRKVMLGFKMETETPMSMIKYWMIIYLQKHNLYLRIHNSGFANGLRNACVGYLAEENPNTADIQEWTNRIGQVINKIWIDDKQLDKQTLADIKAKYPAAVDDYGINLPITIKKGTLTAMFNEKKIQTSVLVLNTPIQYADPVKKILDHALLATKTLPNFVPTDLCHEDPGTYYSVLSQQAKFLHDHRNLSIATVTKEQFDLFNLRDKLSDTHLTHRVYHEARRNRVQVSTTSTHFVEASKWIDTTLAKLALKDFQPKRVTFSSSTKNSASKYSGHFTHAASTPSDSSIDPSTIKTSRSNPWKPRPPIKIKYTASADAFPPLPNTKQPTTLTAITTISTKSTSSECIQTAIDAALKIAETNYDKKFAALSASVTEKLQDVENQMKSMVATIIASTHESLMQSGMFVTKADHLQTHGDIQSMATKINQIMIVLQARFPVQHHSPPQSPTPPPPLQNARILNKPPLESATSTLIPATPCPLRPPPWSANIKWHRCSLASRPSFDPTTHHSPPNQQDNSTLWHGDHLNGEKPANTTRILFNNVHGIKLHGPDETIEYLAHDQHQLDIDVNCISEHCFDTNKPEIKLRLQDHIRHAYPGKSVLQLASSSSITPNQYKPGGTAILAIGDIVGRLEPNGKGGDPMGRWSYLHFRRGQNMAPVTVISVYQVCRNPTNKIGHTAWHQQQLALDDSQRTEHPRKAFCDNLIANIKILQARNHNIIVGGDFNETMEDTNSGLLRLATNTNVTDPWYLQHPHSGPVATQESGRKRIDSILISHRLRPSIRNIGYAPFGYITNSDHRPLLVDFQTDQLFGDDTSLLRPPQYRPFKANDRRGVTDYIEKTHAFLKSNDAFALQTLLDENRGNHTTVEVADRLFGQGSTNAANSCKRRRPEFYSTPLVQQRLRVSLLKAHHLDVSRKLRSRKSALTARALRAGLVIDFYDDQQAARRAWKTATSNLKALQTQHDKLRKTELQAKINDAESGQSKGKAKILRRISKHEDGRRTYQTLRSMKSTSGANNSIDRLEIPRSWPQPHSEVATTDNLEDPKQCTEWTTITEPADIEYYLMLRNRRHFGQAHGTPFTVAPLSTDIDWAASSATAAAILQGQYEKQMDIPQVQALLDSCKAAAELDLIPAEITMEEFAGKIKNWKENTSTSPVSGRDLSRYKALFAPSTYDPKHDEYMHSTFLTKQREFASFALSIINHCIRHGYILERWKTIVNVMIFKDPGDFHIHRLRVIHLYEADFNLMLGVK